MSPLAWSVLSFFLGLILGHWLNLGRDKRKEFNESAAPLREWVLRLLDWPSLGLFEMPTLMQKDSFVQRLGFIKRARFNRLLAELAEEYSRSSRQDAETGAMIYTENEAISQILKKIEPLTRNR